MSARDEKLSTDLGEAAELAIAEHLETLRMDNPEELEIDNPETHEAEKVPNPRWLKVKTLKSRAASDVLQILRAVDPQSMKGRRTDRTKKVLERVLNWPGAAKVTTQ